LRQTEAALKPDEPSVVNAPNSDVSASPFRNTHFGDKAEHCLPPMNRLRERLDFFPCLAKISS